MTPRDIITGLRVGGLCLMLALGSGRIRIGGQLDRLNSAHALNLMLEMHRQHAGCIAFLRSGFRPWQPARCVIGDEIDELLASAWPDAEPDTLGLLRGPLQTAAVVASMRLLVLLAAEGRA